MLRRYRTINSFDWSSIPWDQIGATTGDLIGGWMGTNDQSPTGGGNTNTNVGNNNSGNNQGNNNNLPPSKDNTGLYIAGGLGLAALVFLATQAPNKNRRR